MDGVIFYAFSAGLMEMISYRRKIGLQGAFKKSLRAGDCSSGKRSNGRAEHAP